MPVKSRQQVNLKIKKVNITIFFNFQYLDEVDVDTLVVVGVDTLDEVDTDDDVE